MTRGEKVQFATDLELMHERPMRLGLYATGQRIHNAIRMVGFEIADDITGCIAYEEALAAAEK